MFRTVALIFLLASTATFGCGRIGYDYLERPDAGPTEPDANIADADIADADIADADADAGAGDPCVPFSTVAACDAGAPDAGPAEPSILASGIDRPFGIALAPSHIVFTAEGGTVYRADRDGANRTVLATGSQPLYVVTDGTSVFWADVRSGDIFVVPLLGGPTVSLSSGNNDPYALDIDDTYVFFTQSSDGSLFRVPQAGGATVRLGPPSTVAGQNYALASVFAGLVYANDFRAGRVSRTPVMPGPTELIATATGFAGRVVVDASGVYWHDPATGAIYRTGLAGGPGTALSTGSPHAYDLEPRRDLRLLG